ncbi:SURF1 family protein [Arenimonas sp.]|uniref:SURF1 family protein n=1 Tax=Arenimonas sp. TaxID=1872635 RepID=UPI0037C192CB
MKLRIILLLAAMLVELLLLRLGFWQLARGEEKQQALQAAAAVLQEKQAQPLADALTQLSGFTWVRGHAVFREAPLLLLDNQRRGNQVGVSVFQAADADDGRTLLVDLGWLPVQGDRQLPKPATLSGSMLLEGLLLPPPSPGLAIGPAYTAQADGSLLLMRLDQEALSKALNRPLSGRILRVDPAQRIGFARDLAVQANTLPPEKHRAYALQWFGLAAAFAVLCIGVMMRKTHANR